MGISRELNGYSINGLRTNLLRTAEDKYEFHETNKANRFEGEIPLEPGLLTHTGSTAEHTD